MGIKIDSVTETLAGRLDEESRERKESIMIIDNTVKGLVERIQKLEVTGFSDSHGSKQKVDSTSSSSTWEPACPILGGWPPNSKREDMERDATNWLAAQDKNMTSALLEPWCMGPSAA